MPDAPKLRGEARNEELRATMTPMGAGERPPVLVACAALCALIALGNIVLWASGREVRGQELNALGALVPAALFAAIAVGLWRTRLLAVASMQVLLAITAIFASGALLVASDLRAALLSVAIVVICATLFWPLIRINARVNLRDKVEGHG